MFFNDSYACTRRNLLLLCPFSRLPLAQYEQRRVCQLLHDTSNCGSCFLLRYQYFARCITQQTSRQGKCQRQCFGGPFHECHFGGTCRIVRPLLLCKWKQYLLYAYSRDIYVARACSELRDVSKRHQGGGSHSMHWRDHEARSMQQSRRSRSSWNGCIQHSSCGLHFIRSFSSTCGSSIYRDWEKQLLNELLRSF